MLTGYNGLKLNLTTTYKNKIARTLEKNEETCSTNVQMKYKTNEFSKKEQEHCKDFTKLRNNKQ